MKFRYLLIPAVVALLFHACFALYLGITGLNDFRENERVVYSKVFGAKGFVGEDIEVVKLEWGQLLSQTLGEHWARIDFGASVLISILSVAVFYFLNFSISVGSWKTIRASSKRGVVLWIAVGTLVFSIGSVFHAINSVTVRGVVPYWADSLGIPIIGAIFSFPIVTGILVFIAFSLEIFAGNSEVPLFQKPRSFSEWRFLKAELVGFPFLFLACLLTIGSPETAFAVPFFLHVGLSLRARAMPD